MTKNLQLPRIGSAVIVVDDDRLLLGVRDKEPNRGKWVLPGGKIEAFESIVAAAQREALEETGLEIEVFEQLGTFEIINPPDEHRLIVFSVARPIGGTLRATSDLAELRFFRRDELPGVEMSSFVRAVLEASGWLKRERAAA